MRFKTNNDVRYFSKLKQSQHAQIDCCTVFDGGANVHCVHSERTRAHQILWKLVKVKFGDLCSLLLNSADSTTMLPTSKFGAETHRKNAGTFHELKHSEMSSLKPHKLGTYPGYIIQTKFREFVGSLHVQHMRTKCIFSENVLICTRPTLESANTAVKVPTNSTDFLNR